MPKQVINMLICKYLPRDFIERIRESNVSNVRKYGFGINVALVKIGWKVSNIFFLILTNFISGELYIFLNPSF